jgi:hypothetical protein
LRRALEDNMRTITKTMLALGVLTGVATLNFAGWHS